MGQKKKFFQNTYVKGIVITVIGGLIVLFLWSVITKNKDENIPNQKSIIDSKLKQSPVIINSPGAEVNISSVDNKIQSISVQVRLLCTKKSNAQTPPANVDFLPVGGGSNAKLDDIILEFQSPVHFKSMNNYIEVVNNFILQSGTSIQFKDIEIIKKNYRELSVPVVTVVYGSSLGTIKKLYVNIRVNGIMAFEREWIYDIPYQQGPRFTVPIEWD